MGLSLPTDYCHRCHESIADERPTHRGLAFDTCANAGCHNFHDNRALYTDFLLRHAGEPPLLPSPQVSARTPSPPAARPLDAAGADAPPGFELTARELGQWAASAHARGGVSCTGCHAPSGRAFAREVADATCEKCHQAERDGFRRGRHGMRREVGLPDLVVGDARLPMKRDAHEKSVGCTSCHAAHDFDVRRAAVSACVGCHDDEHSRRYEATRHAASWAADPSGRSGASCATCHLPRLTVDGQTRASHAQNDNLRPSDKMARDVCLSCHGLEFSLDAISDAALVARNFDAAPRRHVRSLEMARAHAARQ
jgi:hypothetical protein